jgi:hypothetical protein
MSSLVGALLAVGVGQAQAGIGETIEADIPFAFHAGDARFPAGKYVVEPLGQDQNVMEIRSLDGDQAAAFMVRSTQAETNPMQTELVFNKYGDQYYLSKLFDEGSLDGAVLTESHYEKLMKKGRGKAETHRVPGHHSSGDPS